MTLEPIARALRFLIPDAAECVYLHGSVQQLGLPLADTLRFERLLVDRLGAGRTLVLPSFPFGNNTEYAAWLDHPITYDVARTPARVNLVGELFRRRPGVMRSLHPILPVAAVGPHAEEIVGASHLDEMPFGPRTSFRRMAARRTLVLGLGVDLNTNSFVHLLDDDLADRLPLQLYAETPVPARLLCDGREVDRRSYRYVTPEIRRTIAPRRLDAVLRGCAFYRVLDGEVPGYSLELGPFLEFARDAADADLRRGRLPAWHVPR